MNQELKEEFEIVNGTPFSTSIQIDIDNRIESDLILERVKLSRSLPNESKLTLSIKPTSSDMDQAS